MSNNNELIGCACRWNADDERVATCTRHQGWLDVVQEWADRAKAAESKIAALASESIANAQMAIKLQALLDANMATNERLQAQIAEAQEREPCAVFLGWNDDGSANLDAACEGPETLDGENIPLYLAAPIARKPDQLLSAADALINQATDEGVVITIERQPLQPLAMGHAAYDISLRPLREKA